MSRMTMRALVFAVALAPLLIGDASAAVTVVNGNTVKKAYANIGTDLAQATETYALLSGAKRKITIPAGGDMVLVTFSAECKLTANSSSAENWVEVAISDNNVVMAPTGDGFGFCGADGYGSRSTRVAKRLAAGDHTIQVFFKIHRGTSGTLTGSLDDWALTILQSD